MSLHLLILAAATSAPAPDIKACADAVHNDLSKAEQACDVGDAQIDLFKPGGLSDACLPAFKAGKQIGKMGEKMAPVMRAALTAISIRSWSLAQTQHLKRKCRS